jgi:ATP-dependent helicase/nuclease subunit A
MSGAGPQNPQIEAADPEISAFVSANAGSGKTSTLVNRVARLLLRGAKPEALLCATYTKAAAAEMQRRLYRQLGGWSTKADDDLRNALAELEDRPAGSFGEKALSRARTLFAKALETPGGLKIQTIHAFCEKLLRRFPLEAGVAPGFRVLEDAEAREVSRLARESLARQALADPDGPIGQAYGHFSIELDYGAFESMFADFETRREAIRAYADACSARGEDIVTDVWRTCGFDAPADPDALEAEAAGACDWPAWRRAAQALLATGASTDTKLGQKLADVAERAAAAVFDECWACFATAAGEPLARLGTARLGAALVEWLRDEQTRLHEALTLARAARTARASVYALTLARAYAALYTYEKHVRGGLDFTDLIQRTVELLTVRSDAAWVLYKLDGGIGHVLVDEAQDTAPEQWEIVRALTEDVFAGEGARGSDVRTVFVVGDEKQSIYSFQGAAPEQLQQEARYYRGRAEQVDALFKDVPLTDSWRSTREVLGFVDAVFADPETRRAAPPAAGDEAVRHAAKRTEAGAVDLWPLIKDEPREEADAWDTPLDAQPAESARKQLARRIADTVSAAIAEGRGVWDGGVLRGATAGDFLILVRRRDALFEEIIRALKRAGVPVAGADRLRLSDHVVFQDLMALVRFALFTHDDLTLAALLRSPFCDLDEQSLYDLAQPRDGKALWAELSARGGERPEWEAARAFLGWARGEAGATPFGFLAGALQRRDGAGRSIRQRFITRLGAEAEDALDEVLAQAIAAENRGLRDLERFAAAMAEADVEVKRELEGANRQVRVMTVHGAKGLEAPIVILPDTTGRPPASRGGLIATEAGGFLWAGRKAEDTEALARARGRLEQRAADEGLRLLYVALTRARDRLIVCGRISARDKGAPEGGWYDRVARAFDTVDARSVVDDGMELRRFGADMTLAPVAAAPARAVAAEPAWLRAPAPPEPPVARYASPTELAEVARGPSPSPLAGGRNLGRFRRGTVIHRLLQLLPDIPLEGRFEAARALAAKEGGLDPGQRAEMIEAALTVLEDPRFAEVFGPGSRAEAAVAGGAPELPKGLAVSGRVDRMVVSPERVLVVDFKTNRPAPARVDQADPAYLIQMAVYVAVLRAVFPGRKVEAALVWTDGPKLMPVPDDVIAARLAELSRAVD